MPHDPFSPRFDPDGSRKAAFDEHCKRTMPPPKPSQSDVDLMNQQNHAEHEAHQRFRAEFPTTSHDNDIAERDAKLLKIRQLARQLIAKNGIDAVACRERDIGLDLIDIIVGDAG